MDNQGYYAILAVSQKANFQEIRKSYRMLAKKYHPDRNKSPNAEERSKKLIKHSKFYLIGRKENNTI
jgi:DnaJ-class molecular chaperone